MQSTAQAVQSSRPVARSARLAWLLCGLVCVLALVKVSLDFQNRIQPSNLIQVVSAIAWSLLPIIFAVVAALIVSRQPRNRIGWLLMSPAIVLSAPVDTYLSSFTTAPAPTFPILWMVWFQSWSWVLLIFPLFLILLLFPTGQPPSPRWRWIQYLALAMALVFVLNASFGETLNEINGAWSLPNPIGWIPDSPAFTTYFLTPWLVSLGVLIIASAASLFVRYRRAAAGERTQIKWLLFAGGIFVVIYIPLLAWQNGSDTEINDAANLLLGLITALFPIAIAIAILRYRLWDIDVIIRKTLVYSLLTASLGLIFFGTVLALQQLFAWITGVKGSPAVIVLSTLAIAALFAPLRRRFQDVIDRRFYRKNYDAQMILEQFSASARDEVEMDRLAALLLSVVEETLHPASASLWLNSRK